MKTLLFVGVICLLTLTASDSPSRADAPQLSDANVNFADDVQPILRRHCYRCHGSKNQEGGLRLNVRDAAMGQADSGEPIVMKHKSAESLLIKRITDEGLGDIMPLDGNSLSRQEIATLSRWIDSGASWPDALADARHWAYQPITRPKIDKSQDDSVGENVIDLIVNRKLRRKGLAPSEPLDRARLLRRLSLSLTGLPPTPEAVQAFVNDKSETAYEQIVDKLLDSPRYGERWAVPWLDLARYADSNGFQADQIRENWAYRDWVVRALNSDMPFDDFVIDQLAGDLRPEATVDQKIATGFHRMTTCNVEAGVHPEANRTNQIVDRVNTTATVFLGSTLECAQCHDHKYDPFTQKDYYRLFAYFNNTPLEVKQVGNGVTFELAGPIMDLPMDDASQAKLSEFQQRVAELEQQRTEITKTADQDFTEWIARIREASAGSVPEWKPVIPERFESTGSEKFEILEDGAVLLSGKVPDRVEHRFTFARSDEPITAIRIDLLTDDRLAGRGPGRGDPKRTNVIVSELTCELVTEKEREFLSLEAPRADYSQPGWNVAGAIDGDLKTGWAFSPQFGKPHWARFTFSEPLTFHSASGQLVVTISQQYGRGRVAGKPRVSILTGDPRTLDIDAEVMLLASKSKRSKAETKKLRAAFDKEHPKLAKLDAMLAAAKKKRDAVRPPTTLVMTELEAPRETFVLGRGDYESPGEKVVAGTPEVLPQVSGIEKTGDRLELARWLTSPSNPLLARVTVNRWWAAFFGTGLVNTPEDFGTQSEDPSHPEILDWLASEFIDSGWSMKHVHKQIVMSAAFRQESRLTTQLAEVDPLNRLISRGPRFRMPAEMIRDNALAVSGLLSVKMYGPPIMPFQPDGIWRSVGRNQPKWVAAETEDRFRRGLYVICKRAAPYPSMINFDAPDRGSCTVRRGRTNTPLQALTLLNDQAYAEMAIAFADRILSNPEATTDVDRLRYAMQLACARVPRAVEIDVLMRLLAAERQELKRSPDQALLRTRVPMQSMQPKTKDRQELAAWFAVTNALLNLDETVSY